MKRSRFLFAVALLAAVGRCEWAPAQVTTYQWSNPGIGDFNDQLNWTPNFVPDANFSEVGVINNGGTAFLDAAGLGAPGALSLGQAAADSGFLEIRPGGALTLVSGTGMNGGLTIGGAGRADATMTGGSLNGVLVTMGGNSANTFSLSGNSALGLTGAATLSRNSRITGPNVSFAVGSLSIPAGATHTAEITGPAHSPMTVTGAATLAGNLRIDLSGYEPVDGDSWKLIDASSLNGRFANVDIAGAELPRGRSVTLDYDLANGDANLQAQNALILTVNRANGQVGIENAIGGPVSITGYAIESAGGLLDDVGWSSFQTSGAAGAGWAEANPQATHLAELNLTDDHALALGGKLALGEAYVSGAIKPADEDLAFSYTTAAGDVVQGIVEYTGPVNDLVLRVDPATGEAALQNLSAFIAPEITGYAITSASGSLDASTWTSLDESGAGGAGWAIANPTENHLAELNLTASTTFTTGKSLSLGTILAAGGSQDLVFQYSTPDNEVLFGTVEYGEITSGVIGDTNGDGNVNLDDLNNVRNNFGATGLGDTDGDNDVDLDDLNNVRNNFGATSGGFQAVPEPGSLALCGVGGLFGWLAAKRRTARRKA